MLADAVENYGQDWQTVAKLVPGHNARQCRERWQFALSPSQTVEWDDEMDARLLKLAGQYGNNYEAIACYFWGAGSAVKYRLSNLIERGRTLRHPRKSSSFVPRVDSRKYFTGGSGRPAFTKKTESLLYANGREVGSRMVYPCIIGPDGATAELPRKGDATSDELSSGMFATIGHIIQWMDYCAQQCDPVLTDDGAVYAYPRADVKREYNNITNLELQSMRYNSQTAYRYGENPLAPCAAGKD